MNGIVPFDTMVFNNPFWAELWRGNKLIMRTGGLNGIVTEGRNYMLNCMFGAGTPVSQVDPWYIGLINNSPTPSLSASDTLASHSGWSEITGTRQSWTDADAASGSKGTTTVSTFPMLGTYNVYGIMVCSVASGTSGVLWATGAFDSVIPVLNGDNLKVGYSVGFAA